MKKEESAELVQIRKKLAQQLLEVEKYVAELALAQRTINFQKAEHSKLISALDAINLGVIFSNGEKEKRAAELQLANTELAFQNEEKRKRAAELVIANTELVFQNTEKEKRAAELQVANAELAYQNEEKEKRAAELIVANAELVFQNTEKEKRAAELELANVELAYQHEEKSKRAAELVIAYTELIHQNTEREKRAHELQLANVELAYQNSEKEKRAAELLIANDVLIFNNTEKEKRATELILINAELEAFTYISSHDLHEPLRKICTFVARILETENENLSARGKDYFNRICTSATHMQVMIDDLLTFSRLKTVDPENLKPVNINRLAGEVVKELKELIDTKSATVSVEADCELKCIPAQLKLALQSLVANSLKFSAAERLPKITIRASVVSGRDANSTLLSVDASYCHITVTDNGIGFDPEHRLKIFDVFQRLHGKSVYNGSGIGLAIVKRVVETHRGFIEAVSEVGSGAVFHLYLPVV